MSGGTAQPGFKPHDEYPYDAGAPIAVAGSVSKGGARVVTVNKEGRIVITTYDKPSLTWRPSSELIKIQKERQVCVINHPTPSHNLFRHSTTISAGQTGVWRDVSYVGFSNTTSEGWDVLPMCTC